jgi:hypothetical protein
VHKFQRFVVTALAVVALAGCGARVDNISVPELDVENATVGGYDFIRFWGDEAPEKLKEVLVEKTQQSKARFESKKNKEPRWEASPFFHLHIWRWCEWRIWRGLVERLDQKRRPAGI